jgi:N6-L-threonylcarbamoyladenine synthase
MFIINLIPDDFQFMMDNNNIFYPKTLSKYFQNFYYRMLFMSTIILSIESSCDDTSAAILKDGKILSNGVSNQTIHEKYGGVVPELASRAHQINIIPVVDYAIKESKIKKEDISAIAFTSGPGLLGSLIVGLSFAKSLALSLGIPIIEVDHMQAHILAHFIDDPKPKFPFLCLTVSGGHTQIVKINDHLEMEIIGKTIDDAAGEAFDKTGKMLGLNYPSGPIIDKLAQLGEPVFEFPTPRVDGLNFSFSGLKTSIRYFLRDGIKSNPKFIEENINNICSSVQIKIVDILISKLIKASKETGINEISIAGGVSANSWLRKKLDITSREMGWNYYIPKFEYCTDNAAMIAIAGYYKFKQDLFCDQSITPNPRKKF